MIGLLVDHNIELQGRLIWSQFTAVNWNSMNVSAFHTIPEVGLDLDATDREVWSSCQQHRLILLTANRNRRGENSLQAVLEQLVVSDSLPVLTISSADRVLDDAIYRELCAYRIADIALELPRYLGTARLFIP